MNDPAPKLSPTRRVLGNAFKLGLGLAVVAFAIQTGMDFFSDAPNQERIAAPQGEPDLGSWTFAGEGLSVAVRKIETGDLDAELRGREPVAVDPTIPIRDGEKQLLELLASHPPTGESKDGRRHWRQQFAGIEVFAETYKTGKDQRLAVARAAWSATGEGLSLLEIRPDAGATSDARPAMAKLPVGAVELARRATAAGVVTGSLASMPAPLETASESLKATLGSDGWTVDAVETGDSAEAKVMTGRRGSERLQIVVLRDRSDNGRSMIMLAKE